MEIFKEMLDSSACKTTGDKHHLREIIVFSFTLGEMPLLRVKLDNTTTLDNTLAAGYDFVTSD